MLKMKVSSDWYYNLLFYGAIIISFIGISTTSAVFAGCSGVIYPVQYSGTCESVAEANSAASGWCSSWNEAYAANSCSCTTRVVYFGNPPQPVVAYVGYTDYPSCSNEVVTPAVGAICSNPADKCCKDPNPCCRSDNPCCVDPTCGQCPLQ